MWSKIVEGIIRALATRGGTALGDALRYAYDKGKVSTVHEENKCPPGGCGPECACDLWKEEQGIVDYEILVRSASSGKSYAYRIPIKELINRYFKCFCCGHYRE